MGKGALMAQGGKVTPIGAPRRGTGGPSGTDDDFAVRLRGVEDEILIIQTEFKHLATKEDLQKLKVWWLCGIIAGMGLAATIALTFVRIFSSS